MQKYVSENVTNIQYSSPGLHEVEGLRERVVCVVTAEDREGLAARLQLLLPGLLALLPLLVRRLAGLLQVEPVLALISFIINSVKDPKFVRNTTS